MASKQEALVKVETLIERFTEQYDSYKSSGYNETLTRRDFIDPFFKALGWDIDNENGYAEAYREVVHEDKIKISGKLKAPDYSFKLAGGKRLFFVEAKKPSILIKEDIVPAYQLRRYGWNDKLAISIITDFEEFAVYDCTKKPNPKDKASTARIKYISYTDYVKEFDFIWDTFSKEAVLKGRFDKFVKSDTLKKGTATVDNEFLKSLDTWRTLLATNIAKQNKQLDEDELNFVVQQTIDRIIFLRIAEDRGIEPYENLKASYKISKNYYHNLFGLFNEADDKYNSGLFDFKKDSLSKNLVVENTVVKNIIDDLYYPNSPYEFSVLSVEILGSAYEQFLGKQIKIDSAHRATIEEKPEVRKAGGVYYTPQYIVDYIVENTIGKQIEGKTPKQIADFKIVDPACGSGSFLLGAYQYLLTWHKDFYTNKGKLPKNKKDSPITPDGNLTTAEKKRILLNNIYGVDIDVNAVEVTKLSLLLKCMEGETQASINHQLGLLRERVLPSLENNIKSGNSLIDTDIYDQELDFGEERKIKPFSWKNAFPQVFENNGGFDAVIGNPPYLGGREWKIENEKIYNYFLNRYTVIEYQFDIYSLFWELGISILKKETGFIGYITPNTWLNNKSCKKLRSYILEKTHIDKIIDYSDVKVFEQATVLPIITILQNFKSKKEETIVFKADGDDNVLINIGSFLQSNWVNNELNIININVSANDLIIRDKVEKIGEKLETFAVVKFGIKLYETGKGNPVQKPNFAKEKIYEAEYKISEDYRMYLEGKDIQTYFIDYKQRWLKYGANLAAPRVPALFEGERILVRRIVGKRLICAFTNEDYVTSQLLQIVKPFDVKQSKYILGLLNSSLLAFYFRKKYSRLDKTFPEIRIYELRSLPIKKISPKNEADKTLQQEIIKNVELLLQLNQELYTTNLQTKKEQLQQRIHYSDDKINQAVYKLYNLTPKEIQIIETAP